MTSTKTRAAIATTTLPILLPCILVLSSFQAHAQRPAIEDFSPRGGPVGEPLTIELKGERLDRISHVLVPNDQIAVESYTAKNERAATLALRIGTDCPVGEHPFWCWGPDGAAAVKTIRIQRFPTLAEVEPNDQLGDAQVVTIPSSHNGITLHGAVEGADIDSFSLELKKNQRLSVECEAIRLGGIFFDPAIELVDQNGVQVAFCDDSPVTRQDPSISWNAENDGYYTIRIREAAFDGEYGARYRLHIGHFCRPLVAFPAGGKLGQRVEMTLIGDGSGSFTQHLKLPTKTPRSDQFVHFFPRCDDGGQAITPVTVHASNLPSFTESEPNDSPDHASRCPAGLVAIDGILGSEGDEDWFELTLPPAQDLKLSVFAARIGSPVDSVVELTDESGNVLVHSDDGYLHDSTIRFATSATNKFRLAIRDHLRRGGPEFVYRIEIAPFQPELELAVTLPESSGEVSPSSIEIPAGGRTAFLVSCRRYGFTGPVALSLPSLPPGVRATIESIPESAHLGMILLEADRDAANEIRLAAIQGSGTGYHSSISGQLKQQIGLTFGDPRQTIYHQLELDQLPIVVTKPYAFEFDATVKSLPGIVDGRSDLPFTLARSSDDLGRVTITPLLLPDWVETTEQDTTVSGETSSGAYPLILRDRIPPGSYPLTLVATAIVDGQPVRFASQQVMLNVESQYAQAQITRAIGSLDQTVKVPCKIEWLRDYPETVTATLRGLPPGATAEPVEIAANQAELEFTVRITADAPPGVHNTLFAEFAFVRNELVVRQYAARGGVLEILNHGDKPQDELSRLQQLRRAAKLD